MTTEHELREKLRKIAALYEGATTAGECEAAAAALNRVHAAFGSAEQTERIVEMNFRLPDSGVGGSFLRSAVDTGSGHFVIHASGIRP